MILPSFFNLKPKFMKFKRNETTAFLSLLFFAFSCVASCKKETSVPPLAAVSEDEFADEAIMSKSVSHDGVTRLALRPCDDGQDTYVTYWYGDSQWVNGTGDWAQELSMDAWTISGIEMGVRSFIRFDNISEVPVGAEIISAKLFLYAKGTSISAPQGNSGYPGSPYSLYNECKIERITGGSWQESTLTWNTQPEVTQQDMAIIPASNSQWAYNAKIDVTNMVRIMANDTSKNFGFRISLVNESIYRSMIFASSENENPKLRPKLVIFYK